MRKRLKKKLRSCAMCKPHKMAKAGRWKPKELDRLRRDEAVATKLRGVSTTLLYLDDPL